MRKTITDCVLITAAYLLFVLLVYFTTIRTPAHRTPEVSNDDPLPLVD